jgi:hypothetical protein
MAFNHINATTFTTPTAIFTAPTGLPRQTPITIYNGHSAAIFIGDVTISTSGATIGSTLNNAARLTLYVNSGDIIYAVSASGSAAGAIVITYAG